MDTSALVTRLRRLGTDLTEVEVKSGAGGMPRSVPETLSAFANGGGGALLLGLDERSGFQPSDGFDAHRIRDAVAGACADALEPPVRAPVAIEEFDGSLVVRIDVPEMDPVDKPCYVKARGAYQGSFIRGGDGDRLLSHYEVTQLLANRTQPTYDVEPVAEATLDDLDGDLVATTIARVRRRSPRAFAGLDDTAVLLRLGVVVRSEDGICATLGGLMALGRYPQQFFPQLFVSFVALPGLAMGETTADGVRFLDNRTIDGPIPLMVAEATAAVQRNMRSAAVITGLFREDRYDYPLDVIRELIVNALMHRDYSPGARGTQVQVELYPDRLLVKSPGGLYGSGAAHDLGTEAQVSSSRNAVLAKLLGDVAALGSREEAICENRGSGLPAVLASLRAADMSPPRFDVVPSHVHVTVPQHALLSVETIEWIGSLGEEGLTNPQHQALAMMRANGRVTNGMLQAWGVDSATAGAALRDLVGRNLAVMSGGRRYASYRLATDEVRPPVRATAPTHKRQSAGVEADLDAILQAIRAGHTTSRALEKLLGIGYQVVLRRLRILQDRGLVEPTQPKSSRNQSYRLHRGERIMSRRRLISEADWEDIALEALAEQEWEPLHGRDIAPGREGGRTSWSELHLPDRLLAAMQRLNPHVPAPYLPQALAEIVQPKSQDAIAENYGLHRICVNGFPFSFLDDDGVEQHPTIRVVSHLVADNELIAVRQVTIRSTDVERRFDVVCYLNGLPVAVIELKQAGAAHADLASAHAQLATYLREFPLAFRFTVLSVVTDGITARYGTPFTPLHHYSPWNVDEDGKPVRLGESLDDIHFGTELEFLIEGVFNPERFLQLQRNFTAYDESSEGLSKRIAKPHQYFAVTKAVGTTVAAVESNGKAGVVWHTQGSGKSMEMELYAHLVGKQPKLQNPTILVVTDRHELDGQLHDRFRQSLLLGETPEQVTSRDLLRASLRERVTGGIYFTTLQKFQLTDAERASGSVHPLLSERRNIIVIVDEAHRSHYDDLDGYARHLADALPNATLIAFTGTPISFDDRNTRAVFGDYIDVYDLTRAVDDGATVPVSFEARLIGVRLAGDVTEEELDQAADEATVGLDEVERARVEQSVAVINQVYGAPARLKALAADIVEHWETRSAQMRKFLQSPGKAFVVGATREICARLYDQIVALRPEWHDEADERGVIKVVYSGSASDTGPVARHVRRSGQVKAIRGRLRDPDDPLQIVIVKDMMLTGFDAPPLHTLYLDRPLQGALLMQTLARVNRTFRGKQDGLLVGYAPLAENLHKALAEYTDTDRATRPVGKNLDEAISTTRELIERLDELCSGYAWRARLDGSQRAWIRAATGLVSHLRSPATPGNGDTEEETLGDRFRRLANQLARAWALCAGSETLSDLRGTARFYEEVRVWMAKYDATERQAEGRPVPEEIERMLATLVADSTATGEIVDIYEAAGIPKPSLSDLGPDFRVTAEKASNPHLAIEALRALLVEESRQVSRHNVVRQRAFSERIKELMNRYTNSQLTSAEVIAELIEMAQEVAAEADRGKQFTPALNEDELAFYDAVSTNPSAVELQGEEVLAQIARDLVAVMRRDTKTDWTVRDDVRAKLRSSIKRLLVKHKYPPDRQPDAIQLVFEQMESMARRAA